MGKRKDHDSLVEEAAQVDGPPSKSRRINGILDVRSSAIFIQIIAGSYERLLHGVCASVTLAPDADDPATVKFTDTFLFNAHATAVRCLALSPAPDATSSETQGFYLATGGSDERINVYSLAASPPNEKLPPMP